MRRTIQQLTMAVLLGALALTPSTAQAMEENLIDSMLCLAHDQILIDIDEPGALDLAQFAGRVYDELKRQVVNARIPFQEELATNDVKCGFSAYAVYVFVGSTGGSTRAWVVNLDVTDFLAPDYHSWVEIWNSLLYGTSTRSGGALGDELFGHVRSEIRGLVDAWQSAN